jgi:iron-regulated transporter 1
MLTYLLSHSYTDAFLAGMRGVCVVTGLMGTVIMPFLERKIGVVRTGTWSIFSELFSLIPVLLAFFISAPREGERGTTTYAALLFTGEFPNLYPVHMSLR